MDSSNVSSTLSTGRSVPAFSMFMPSLISEYRGSAGRWNAEKHEDAIYARDQVAEAIDARNEVDENATSGELEYTGDSVRNLATEADKDLDQQQMTAMKGR